MKKILKIRFVKFEFALAMQILEQKGLPKTKEDGYVKITTCPNLGTDTICLRGKYFLNDWLVSVRHFESNEIRDAQLSKIVNNINNELFCDSSSCNIKVGDKCEVSDTSDFSSCYIGEIISILPKGLKQRYIIRSDWGEGGWVAGEYARKIHPNPKVEENNNDIIYTWEE